MEFTCESCQSVWSTTDVKREAFIASLIECPLCCREEDESEEPVTEPIKVPVKPKPKPKEKRKQFDARKIRSGRKAFRYPDGLRNFLIKNINGMKNPELMQAVNKEFDLDMSYSNLASYMKYNNIKRSNTISKSQSGKGEKKLPTLPPEDNY